MTCPALNSRRVAQFASLLVGSSLLLPACAVDTTTQDIPKRSKERPATQSPKPTVDPGDPPGPNLTGQTKGPVSHGWSVSRTVDGDTVEVNRRGRTLTLRLIGVDTPETVHPTVPVECFGPEASAFTNRRLSGERVSLEFDRSQGRQDYYGRTLAYVWLRGALGPVLFNEQVVAKGFAEEYTYDAAYTWQTRLRQAQARAIADERGLWQACR